MKEIVDLSYQPRVPRAFTLTGAVRSCVRALVGTDVPANAPLMSVGVDSVGTSELVNVISKETGMTLSALVLFDHPTIDTIASYLTEK